MPILTIQVEVEVSDRTYDLFRSWNKAVEQGRKAVREKINSYFADLCDAEATKVDDLAAVQAASFGIDLRGRWRDNAKAFREDDWTTNLERKRENNRLRQQRHRDRHKG